MRLPAILSFYIGRHFLFSVLAVLAIMVGILSIIELLELVRESSTRPKGVPFFVILEMMLLKLPTSAEHIYPFGFLIGGMVTFSRLARTNELMVARSAGVSVWQFLLPGVVVAVALGAFFVGIMNPIAAATVARFDRLEARYISGKASILSISPSGLWLRQVGEEGILFKDQLADEYVLHALRIDQGTLTLDHVIIFLYRAKVGFIGRIDADKAVLTKGAWLVQNATLSSPGTASEILQEYVMPTQLTLNQIQDSFSAPETFSFWALPSFIGVLEKAGFSALRHKLHFYSLMAMPLLFAGMLMLAAVFTLRQPRRGRTGMLVVAGVVSGFLFYFVTNLIYAMGSAGTLPVFLAAVAPSLIVTMLAGAALLHLEDG